MTAERFTYFLNNPEHLYQISYQELKSLVVQYPYCQNLRYLLVTKSQIEDAEEYEKDLQLAATYALDRSYLYQLIQKEKTTESDSENFVLNDDYLELKNISPTTTTPLEVNSEPIVLEQITGESGIATSTPQDDFEMFPNTPLFEETEEKEIEINIPQEGKTIEATTDLEKTNETEETEIHQPAESEAPQAAIPEPNAERISDESEMVNYMKKPKRSKSVIEQLLGKYEPSALANQEKVLPLPDEENKINLEDELESPEVPTDNFMDLSPVKEEPTLGREVLFEITNKTDREIDALMQKAEDGKKEESTLDENILTMDHLEKNNTSDTPPSSPTPKTSFKSYMKQFQPSGLLEEMEEEKELAHAIDEAVEEEHLSTATVPKKDKKKKSKKQKKMSVAVKSKTDKKKDKGKKKKAKKVKVIKVAKKSLKESEDVLSETLAELLGKQGSRKKAIQMYKRLSLIFPEKSSFFAKKIKKLKK